MNSVTFVDKVSHAKGFHVNVTKKVKNV